VKLTAAGATATTGAPALTWIAIVAVMLGLEASATVRTHAPAAAGTIEMVVPLTGAFATPLQPVRLNGAAPPAIATVCTAEVGAAKLTLAALKFSGGAVPIRILAIIPPPSCERM
jgi:hypothetical protein